MKLAHIFKDSIIEEASNLQELSPELRDKGEDWWYDSLFGKRKDAYELLKILLSDNNGDLKKTLDDIIKRQRDLDNVDGKKYPGKEYVSYRLTVLEKLTKELLKDKIREGKEEEKDPEGQMAKVQLKKIAEYADKISKGLKDESQLDAWVQDHIARASELMDQVGHFMDGKK